MSFSARRIRRSHHQRLPIAVVTVIALSLVALAFLGMAAFAGADDLTSGLPDLNAPLPALANTTKIFASDGSLLTDLYYAENRVPVPISAMPTDLVNAVVAAEDERFFTNNGVDLKSIGRALVVDLRSGRVLEGGSTITQQLVKNLYGQRERTMRRKVREAILAYKLEQHYPKKLILERYLNTIYLGQSAYGVEAASRMYFGHSAKAVTLPEAALLAGIIRSPNNTSPYVSKTAARQRRGTVLGQMAAQGLITTAQAVAAARAPLRVIPQRTPAGKAAYFVDYVKHLLIRAYGADAVFKGGLRVRTTLDPRLQELAERAAWGTLDQRGDPSVALVAIDPQKGAIRAMVGGRDFARLSYNLATQAHRQPGSAFKPFVLATALSQGHSLTSPIDSDPGTLKVPGGGSWTVSNATEGSGGGLISLHDATVYSVNCAFARLILDVGADQVVETAQRMGITTPLNPDPAIALGGLKHGVTPLEMASAYGTFAAGGFHVEPVAVEDVRTLTERREPPQSATAEPVLDPAVAAMVTSTLKDVIRDGTGRRAQISVPAAGKTGTTQDYRDAWFVGYTPKLVTAVWVGYVSHQRSMYDVHGTRVFGGTFPAEIWARFMEPATKGSPGLQFAGVPKGSLVKVRICDVSGLLATPYCPHPIAAQFLKGHIPAKSCPLHAAPPPGPVPGVLGMPVAKATTVMSAAGFAPSPTYQMSDSPQGTVIGQRPSPGAIAKPGTVVALTVSSGPFASGTNEPPRPAILLSNPNPGVGESVIFDGSASSDADGSIAHYQWTFGDGSSAAGATLRHKYRALGGYAVTLTVIDDQGQTQSLSRQVTVDH